MIPRIIHQIYLSGTLPAPLQANVDRLKAANPAYEHRLFDAARAEAFIARRYGPEMLALYRRIDPRYGAARADLLRHLIIFDSGGVYLDMKSSFDRPIDDAIRDDDHYVLTQWRNGPGEANAGWGLHHDLSGVPGGEYLSHFVIAEPGHVFSASAIARISRNIRAYKPWSAVGRTGVLRTTGPIAYTLAVHPLLADHPHRFAEEAELGVVYSIGDDYDHQAAFRAHYSTLTVPVIMLSRSGRALNRVFVKLREIKTYFR